MIKTSIQHDTQVSCSNWFFIQVYVGENVNFNSIESYVLVCDGNKYGTFNFIAFVDTNYAGNVNARPLIHYIQHHLYARDYDREARPLFRCLGIQFQLGSNIKFAIYSEITGLETLYRRVCM